MGKHGTPEPLPKLAIPASVGGTLQESKATKPALTQMGCSRLPAPPFSGQRFVLPVEYYGSTWGLKPQETKGL